MQVYSFNDVLAHSTVLCQYPNMASSTRPFEGEDGLCESVFFPGCSFLNYGMPLVKAVYDTLVQAGSVQGISLVCCGKILSYEPNGNELRPQFEEQLRARALARGVKRFITACPNCTKALRDAFAAAPETAEIEVVPLPVELARLGYCVAPESALAVAGPEVAGGAPIFAPHDSCPDRETGEFAAAVRQLMENVEMREMAHNRKTSICCGSLARAAGSMAGAQKCSALKAREAQDAGANALVTACVSCTNLLMMLQKDVPAFHYLELLYQWRIDWVHADPYMRLRFLFEADSDAENGRAFMGLSDDGQAKA